MGDEALHTFSARLDCHYLLRAPEAVSSGSILVVTLHGFGATPEAMLSLTGRLFDEGAVVASLQGPYQFFLGRNTRDVGYGWITSSRPAESIRLHHDMVSHVLSDAGERYGIPPERRFLAGFSQPVSLNYRFAASCPGAVRGVVAVCGGLPGDWESGQYGNVSAAVLHIARRHDEFYAPEATRHYAERLRLRAADVEFHLIDGGHRMPSSGNSIVDPWLRRVLGPA